MNRSARVCAVVAVAAVAHVTLLAAPVVLIKGFSIVVTDSRLPLFLLVVSVWLALESAVTLGEPQRASGSRRRPLLEIEIGVAILLVFWVSALETDQVRMNGFGRTALLGLALMLAGVVLRSVSIRTLGRFFLNEVAVVPGQCLVTHGVYGVVRHPSEVGTLCVALGAVIMWQSMLGLAAFLLLLLPGVIRRTRLEDRMLRRQYPVAFAHYSRDVGALLPRLPWMCNGRRHVLHDST